MRGVAPAGLNSTVLPYASAGAIFQAGMAMGKFQGVMAATTPTGPRCVYRRVPGTADAYTWPMGSLVWPAK